MIQWILIIGFLIALNGCSSKPPIYKWRTNSASAFSSYTQSFLQGEQSGSGELDIAIDEAKRSADLEQLASIYLGVCALNRAVGVDDRCQKYQKISHLLVSKKLNAYYRLLHDTITPTDLEAIPPQYRPFAKAKLERNHVQAFEALMQIKKPTSKLIGAALIKEHLSPAQREQVLTLASQYGYKRAVLFWLDQKVHYTQNPTQKRRLKEKIMELK